MKDKESHRITWGIAVALFPSVALLGYLRSEWLLESCAGIVSSVSNIADLMVDSVSLVWAIPQTTTVAAAITCMALGLAGFLARYERKRLVADIRDFEQTSNLLDESFTGMLANRPATLNAVVPVDKAAKILAWNDGARDLFGYPAEQIAGQSLSRILSPDSEEKFRELWTRIEAMDEDHAISETTRLRGQRMDGTDVPLELAIASWRKTRKGMTYVCSLRDITERKRAEQNVINLARFSSDNPGPVLRVAPGGTLLYVNEAGQALLDEWNRDMGQLIPGKWRRLVAEAIESGERPEIEAVFGDRAFSFVFAPASDRGYVSIFGQDITKLKGTEDALREANDRLQDAVYRLQRAESRVREERLQALGQMASGIAHDINNALMSILGFAELPLIAPEYMEDKDKLKRALENIQAAAQDAGAVVNRLREFYRVRADEGELRSVDLSEIAEQTIWLTEPKWKGQAQANGRTVTFQTAFQPGTAVRGDESELREALTNLIFNAVDAMPDGGTITLATRAHGKHAVLEISDTGTGMTEEVRQRCLEPFYTTKEQGSGLGLASVHGVIRRHGGELEVKSREGQGTTFTLSIPLAVQGVEESQGHVEVVCANAMKVLVVDDEPGVRDIVSEYLAIDGHTVDTARNGEEGLAKFRSGGFDVVITDQAMPQMNGELLAANIKQFAPHVPVVLLSGFGDMMKSRGEKPDNVDLVLGKPITLTEMRSALASVA